MIMRIYFVLTLGLAGLLLAQNTLELEKLYRAGKLEQLRVKTNGFSSSTNPDLLYYKALLTSNGEAAQKIYARVFDAGSKAYKVRAAKKLMDYYYAVGYYVTAEKYQKFIAENSTPEDVLNAPETVSQPVSKPSATPESGYVIQVGAFGLPDNAEQQVKFLATQDVTARVVQRKVNEKVLYCVWVNGKPDFDRTLKYANRLKQTFDLEFRIMKK